MDSMAAVDAERAVFHTEIGGKHRIFSAGAEQGGGAGLSETDGVGRHGRAG